MPPKPQTPRHKRSATPKRRRSATPKRRRSAKAKREHSAKPRCRRSATPRTRQSSLRRHHSGTRSNRAARPPTFRNTSTATRTVNMRKRRASACLNWRTPGWRRPPRSKKKGKRESRRSSSRRRSSGESEPVAEPDPETGGFFGDRVRGRGDDPEVVLVLLVSQIGGYSQRRGDRVGIGSPEAETEGGVGGIVERAVLLPQYRRHHLRFQPRGSLYLPDHPGAGSNRRFEIPAIQVQLRGRHHDCVHGHRKSRQSRGQARLPVLIRR